jgi:hypothetical protein
LSEPQKFSSKEVKVWLERETRSLFNPIHSKARKQVEEMGKSVNNLAETSKMLLDNSAKEIDKRNMKTYKRARALNKLAKLWTERIRQLNIPEKVTYEDFSKLVQETQKAFALVDMDIRVYFPRISPFFILDRRKFQAVFEKAKFIQRDLESFQTKEYVKTKTLEETYKLIDELSTLESQLAELSMAKLRVENEISSIQKAIAETANKIAELKTMGEVGQLGQTRKEIETLTSEVKHRLHYLHKPFIKLQALATRGSGSGLTPEEYAKLVQYLENRFEALSTEDTGYPLLKQILEKLRRNIVEDKLKLKPDKARKAEQAIDDIINSDSFAALHKQCKDAMTRKTQLSKSEEVAATQKDLTKLREHSEDLTRKRGVLETEEITTSRNCQEIAEKIRSVKREIEKNVLSFMDKKITVT